GSCHERVASFLVVNRYLNKEGLTWGYWLVESKLVDASLDHDWASWGEHRLGVELQPQSSAVRSFRGHHDVIDISQWVESLRQLRASQGVVARDGNLGSYVIWLVWLHVGGQSLKHWVLCSPIGEHHGVGGTVDGSARRYLSAVVL